MSETILRRKERTDGLSFVELRKEGLSLAQQLSGDIWTDYNIHDPGVTILEQLCYALTELAYRSDFSVADFLTDSDGQIPYTNNGLYLPEEIFPCAPITKVDFCRYLYSKLSSVEDVSIQATKLGLHTVYVRPYFPMDTNHDQSSDLKWIKKQIESAWLHSRNLCEDLDHVEIHSLEPCYLDGEVEIQGGTQPAEILANIYFRCSRLVASDIRTERYDSLIAKGLTLEEIFSGPLCPAGFHHEDGFQDTDQALSEVKLISEVGLIKGVSRIRRLSLLDKVGSQYQFHGQHSFLQVPNLTVAGPMVHLSLNGHRIPYTMSLQSETMNIIRKLEFEYRAFRAGERLRDQLPPLPKGEARPFSQYSTVRDHFPEIYGVSEQGLPRSVPEEYHRGAQQLKQYLNAPEQVLQDTLQTMERFKDLYDLKPTSFSTYFSNNRVSNQHLAKLDDSLERRHRFLDQGLGIYGVEFSNELWAHLHGEGKEAHAWMLDCKIKYMEELCSHSYARGQLSYWLRRIELLLGLRIDQIPAVIEPLLLRNRSGVPDPRLPYFANIMAICWRKEKLPPHSQKQVEIYVKGHVPAHVLPHFIWLNEKEWLDLNLVFIPWNESWKAFCAGEMESHELERQSQPLLKWLEMSFPKRSQSEVY